jgi:3-hydroxyacyl-CoA dehydrogenase/enoyl-CoA hydratase/3-hydroxybutyryl-CoA epimerase
MIQTMFLGRVDYERLERKQQLPGLVAKAVELVKAEVGASGAAREALAAAGFAGLGPIAPPRERERPGYWVESDEPRARVALAVLRRIHEAAIPLSAGSSEEDRRVADYAAVTQAGYPAYLGGPFSYRPDLTAAAKQIVN